MKFTLVVAMCDPTHYLPLATAAEAAGFDALCVPDSLFFPERAEGRYPYTPSGDRSFLDGAPFLDPFVVIPAMAAVTERLRFYTYVLKLPIRHPLIVAKTVSSAAVLSRNRVGLGVGLSPWIEDFRYCGQDWTSRGPRMDEMIAILRHVLSGEMVEHHGAHYDFDRLKLSPVPSEPVPIYIGGHSTAALRRAARLGDGWCTAGTDLETLRGLVERLRALRREFGRESEPFEIQALCPEIRDLDGFRRMEEAGATDAIVGPWGIYDVDPLSVAQKQEAVRRFGEEIIAKL
ncbi:MAG: TIGR03619 family F420-dependent LLM class oxidoreductase [Myxococcota bacterium]